MSKFITLIVTQIEYFRYNTIQGKLSTIMKMISSQNIKSFIGVFLANIKVDFNLFLAYNHISIL